MFNPCKKENTNLEKKYPPKKSPQKFSSPKEFILQIVSLKKISPKYL